MGFPVVYTKELLPKLLINLLSLLGFIRSLIFTFLRLLDLSKFLQPDIICSDLYPAQYSTSHSQHLHHQHLHNTQSSSPLHDHHDSQLSPVSLSVSLSASLIREILPEVSKFSEVETTVIGSESEPPELCSVCLNDFEGEDEIQPLRNCRHIFHRCCLDRWLECDQRNCPLCRTQFVPDELMNSFNERLWATSMSSTAAFVPDFYGQFLPLPSL